MNEATLKVVCGDEQRQDDAGDGEHRRGENGDRRREVAELGKQHAEDQRQRQQQHAQQIVEGFLLLLVGAAVLHAHGGGQMQAGDGLLDPGHCLSEVRALEAAGDNDELLQVFAADLVLRRQLLDVGQRAEGRGVAGSAVEDGVLDRVERGARLVAEAHANGVGAAVRDQRIGGRDAVENRGRIFGDFSRREAEARRDDGIDLEVGGRAADGVVDAVLDIDHAVDFADGVAHPGAELAPAVPDRLRRA